MKRRLARRRRGAPLAFGASLATADDLASGYEQAVYDDQRL